MRRMSQGALLAAILVALSPASAAAVLSPNTTVDEYDDPAPMGSDCSLREAVEAANTDGVFGGCSDTDNDDEGVSLDAGSIYVLTRDGIDDTNVAGDLDIKNEGLGLNAFSGDVTIRGDMDMVGDDRVVDVQSTAPGFGLLAVTIRDGRADTAFANGGGVRTAAPAGDSSHISLSTITANRANAHGGGLEVGGSGLVFVENTTISGNLAGGDGGGIDHSGGGTILVKNSTVTDNTADSEMAGGETGGGIVSFGVTTETRLYNSIVAGNHDLSGPAGFAPDCKEHLGGAQLLSETHNLIGTTTGCEGISAGTADIRNADPLLAPLALNRPGNLRNTATHALLPGSPARDAGDPASCEDTDQTNTPRPIGSACDIGAFEADLVPKAAAATLPAAGTPPVAKKRCKKKKRHAAAAKKKKCKKKKRK
jgi:CSLREA domain-containing protein